MRQQPVLSQESAHSEWAPMYCISRGFGRHRCLPRAPVSIYFIKNTTSTTYLIICLPFILVLRFTNLFPYYNIIISYTQLSDYSTVLHSKRVYFFLTLHAYLFLPTMNRNITFSSGISVQNVKQRPLHNRRYDKLWRSLVPRPLWRWSGITCII